MTSAIECSEATTLLTRARRALARKRLARSLARQGRARQGLRLLDNITNVAAIAALRGLHPAENSTPLDDVYSDLVMLARNITEKVHRHGADGLVQLANAVDAVELSRASSADAPPQAIIPPPAVVIASSPTSSPEPSGCSASMATWAREARARPPSPSSPTAVAAATCCSPPSSPNEEVPRTRPAHDLFVAAVEEELARDLSATCKESETDSAPAEDTWLHASLAAAAEDEASETNTAQEEVTAAALSAAASRRGSITSRRGSACSITQADHEAEGGTVAIAQGSMIIPSSKRGIRMRRPRSATADSPLE
jgi:hypothetical protein